MFFVGRDWAVSRESPFFKNSLIWLLGALVIAFSTYASHYLLASQSDQFVAFIASITCGCVVEIWTAKRQCETSNVINAIIISFLVIIAIISLWGTDWSHTFEYRGRIRWTGPWQNPNVAGLVMGVGAILGVGWTFRTLDSTNQCLESKISKCLRWGATISCLLAVVLTTRGLFLSYSRGAWLASGFGISYLAAGISKAECDYNAKQLRLSRCCAVRTWLRRNRMAFGITIFAMCFIGFWHFQQTEWRPIRRLLSISDQNDFSWRNRIAAWEGALQMMNERPWCGSGWSQSEKVYENYYLDLKIEDGMALDTNDYLNVGAMLGIPALFCLAIYIWRSLTDKLESGARDHRRVRMICRAAAIVLALGFWFDGGLFLWPLASTFWIFLVLGNLRSEEYE